MTAHLSQLVDERVRHYPNAIALGWQAGLRWQTLDSRQVLDLVERLAAELAAAGVGTGDRVILWLPNHGWAPLYLFAIWRLGAIAVPFDREMNAEGARRIIGLTEPALILAGYGERPAWADGDVATEWWEPGRRAGEGESGRGGEREPGSKGAEEQKGEDLAVISFTSGTTGLPKGCMLTHGNLLSQLEGLREMIPVGPNDRLASILPLSHVLELTVGLLYPFSRGAAIHYVPSRRGPDIVRVFKEQRVSHMVAVPQVLGAMAEAADRQLRERLPGPVYRGMMAAAERLPLSGRRLLFGFLHQRLGGRLRVIGSGGAALPPETQRFWERLGVRIIQGYGTSETAPIITGGAADGSTPVGSVGRPVRGVEVRLTGDGELTTRGPNVMRGYWKDPERTATVLIDGWYHTGDLARIDHDGNIWLLGRAKEMIVLPSGMKVWPSDIEEVLRGQPSIKDAAVVPVATAGGGMTLHAFLIPRSSEVAAGDPRVPIAAANAELAVHQRVATASWWPDEDFPRTTTLKVRRHLLPVPDTAALGARPNGALVAPVTATAASDPVVQAIQAVARIDRANDSATLAELGFDSLTLIELALALQEKTGVAVADEDLHAGLTVEEVRALVGHAPAINAETARVQRAQYDEGGDPPRWFYGPIGQRLRGLSLPFRLLFRLGISEVRVLGADHLCDLPPRVVLAGTHRSWPDVMVLRQALRQTTRSLERRLIVPGAAWMTRRAGPLGVYAMLAFGLFPLRQYRDQDHCLRLLVSLADGGNPVLIFPQGHHADPAAERAGDPVANFKTGAALIAEAMDAVIVPFGLVGTERIMPPTAEGFKGLAIAGIPISIHRGPVAIAFGPPLKLEPGETPQALTRRLQAASFGLAQQAELVLSAIRADEPARA